MLRLAHLLILVLAAVLAAGCGTTQDPRLALDDPVDAERCYDCHAQIRDLHAGGQHEAVNCAHCHSDTHLCAEEQGRPSTRMDHLACGTCHEKQYESFFAMNWDRPARMEKSQLTGKSPNPSWDLLMMPHGFTREHNLPRSHSFALIDFLLVDRAFGGRFQPADSWQYLTRWGDLKAWDLLYERHTDDAHRPFAHGTGAFANPVCFNCKTQDHILDWAYMGDPEAGATWSRTSKPYEMAKAVNHTLNCFTCHDPHSARPRIVRDALIDALTRPAAESETLWVRGPRHNTEIQVLEMGVRGYTRKIGILNRYDTRLLCGQCHVTYNCNPGLDTAEGVSIGMADPRSNYFPFVDVWGLEKDYDRIAFRDYRHGITGAPLIKMQHPDAETYWGSVHDQARVDCRDCHMPRMGGDEPYTSHWQTNPRQYLAATCLSCHTGWDETQAKYAIDSAKNHLSGKMRKAEFWLARLIEKFIEARAAGVDEAVLEAARQKHTQAHIHWEWWTAEASGGFHNIDQAKESLNTSMIRSMEGIKILDEAIEARRGTSTGFNTPLAAGHFVGVEPVR